MSKTIKELARQFTDELFAGDDLSDFDTQTEKNDAYVTCMAFGNYLMKQPLSVRLTAEEKERVRKEYANTYPLDPDCGVANILIQGVLERIFGKDVFKEEE